jgi:hypothetical protein
MTLSRSISVAQLMDALCIKRTKAYEIAQEIGGFYVGSSFRIEEKDFLAWKAKQRCRTASTSAAKSGGSEATRSRDKGGPRIAKAKRRQSLSEPSASESGDTEDGLRCETALRCAADGPPGTLGRQTTEGSLRIMKERPVLFSPPMVRALLDGSKSQTRRIVKWPRAAFLHGRTPLIDRTFKDGAPGAEYIHCAYGSGDLGDDYQSSRVFCPYGDPGDRLWVKETWSTSKSLDDKSPSAIALQSAQAGYERPWAPLRYAADDRIVNWDPSIWGDAGKTRVSIHMPRWASRITLEVTGVRVQRLQDISEANAKAEGVSLAQLSGIGDEQSIIDSKKTKGSHPRTLAFAILWDTINGDRASWRSNPWVWIVEFKRIEQATRAA